MRRTGYFNAAGHMLRIGDMLMANTNTDAAQTAGIFLVASNSAGIVDLSDLTQVGAADTD